MDQQSVTGSCFERGECHRGDRLRDWEKSTDGDAVLKNGRTGWDTGSWLGYVAVGAEYSKNWNCDSSIWMKAVEGERHYGGDSSLAANRCHDGQDGASCCPRTARMTRRISNSLWLGGCQATKTMHCAHCAFP